MKKNIAVVVALITLVFSLSAGFLVNDAYAVTCFKKGEYISGFNKICIYNCLGSDRAITIRSTQLCPLSING